MYKKYLAMGLGLALGRNLLTQKALKLASQKFRQMMKAFRDGLILKTILPLDIIVNLFSQSSVPVQISF